MRIGYGFDAHRFGEGRKLVLGGVHIDFPTGLEGHSDADVLTHARIDALLGAASLGDIGMHFPDTDPTYRDASSIHLLETVSKAVDALGFVIENIDTTVFAQVPKIGPYRASMVENLARAASIDADLVNVKATTTEGLGFIGRVEGIAAAAVVLLKEKPA
ncbi:MAG: 2-C-methyl-D-erythritol 2,4-cyclodiphosphate synthase [Pseudomonadota bacterium]